MNEKNAKFKSYSIYTSYKPADIVKEILIHVICASDLNSILFAFVIFKICISFFIRIFIRNTIGRGKRKLHASTINAVTAPLESRDSA